MEIDVHTTIQVYTVHNWSNRPISSALVDPFGCNKIQNIIIYYIICFNVGSLYAVYFS